MVLVNDRVEVRWPGVGTEPIFEKVNQRLIEATKALGGTFVRNPLWTGLFKHHLMTVHPLGGCVMAETADGGAVNHKGQVFSGEAGTDVHDGLYVADGSVIPRPLGCQPAAHDLGARRAHVRADRRRSRLDDRLRAAVGPVAAPAACGRHRRDRVHRAHGRALLDAHPR